MQVASDGTTSSYFDAGSSLIHGNGAANGGGVPAGSRLAQWQHRSPASIASIPSFSPNARSFVPAFAQQQQQQQQQVTSEIGKLSFGSVPRQQSPYGGSDVNGTMYFYGQAPGEQQIIDDGVADPYDGAVNPSTHVIMDTLGSFAYAGTLPYVTRAPKGAKTQNWQLISGDVKKELIERQLAMLSIADRSVYPDLPDIVEHYRIQAPLEVISPPDKLPQTTVYKAVCTRDAAVYCLRRVHAYRLPNLKALQPTENWKKLVNVGVVQLREVIANTQAFGDTSLVFVYDYHPNAETLLQRYFNPNNQPAGSSRMEGGLPGACSPVPEATLWQLFIQLSSALRTIHSSGMAARNISLDKIIVTGRSKVMLAACGIPDVISPESAPIQQLQTDDLQALGRVLLCLATGNSQAARRDMLQHSVHFISQRYTADMRNVVSLLLSPQRHTINEVMPMIGARFYGQLEAAQSRVDLLEHELSKELENGRLLRLLVKLNTIVERPEFNMSADWAEQGDKFLLKLFRDYVFHQTTESGKPWLDMAHIVHCLNKLDAGVDERVQLASRDGQNMLVVSYTDLRRCLETAFGELTAASNRPPLM